MIAALVVVGAALTGCSKKANYGADTSAAAVDTTSTTSTMTASSTAPAMQDTTASTSTKSTTKRSTGKKAPKKASYWAGHPGRIPSAVRDPLLAGRRRSLASPAFLR